MLSSEHKRYCNYYCYAEKVVRAVREELLELKPICDQDITNRLSELVLSNAGIELVFVEGKDTMRRFPQMCASAKSRTPISLRYFTRMDTEKGLITPDVLMQLSIGIVLACLPADLVDNLSFDETMTTFAKRGKCQKYATLMHQLYDALVQTVQCSKDD